MAIGSPTITTPYAPQGAHRREEFAALQLHWNRKRIGELLATHQLQIENETSETWYMGVS